ncbi:MAG: UMP kinase [Candidatus Moranbacteria bacterium]|nr:UMP kinase [bacterium]MDP1833460.1 UMP kinase [Candidatus Moranbacteria bacterium]
MDKKTIIISLGGSLIVPEEIDWKFVKKFKALIEEQIENGFKFILITGGGKTARKYIDASAKIDDINNEDKDWIGIHATRMNAHFIRTIFRKHAHPRINKNPHDLEDFYNFKESILVAAGWRPGFSTDFDAVLLAKYLGIKTVINLSNIDYVCDKDPRKFPDAKKIEEISWAEFRKMVGDKWDPGMNAPFDPIASKEAQEIGLEVAIMNGQNLANLKKYLEGKKAKGTIIK